MTRTMPRIALITALAALPPAHAQSQRPGLWEHTSTYQSASGEIAQAMAEMHRQLAAMPPEQRRMMERMLAQQGTGLAADGRSTKIQYCLSPQEAAKAGIPSHDEACQYTVIRRSGSGLRVRFVCRDASRTQGEGEFRYEGETAYSGSFRVRMVVDGKPQQMEMTQSGRWLSADCGPIKPKLQQRTP